MQKRDKKWYNISEIVVPLHRQKTKGIKPKGKDLYKGHLDLIFSYRGYLGNKIDLFRLIG